MKLIIKILKTIKYLALRVSYRLFNLEKKNGYNDLELNKSIIKKTIEFSKLVTINDRDKNIRRTLRFLEFIKKKKIKNIIDFGGGAGYHYFIARMKLNNFNLKWSVVENRIMVKLCNKKLKYKNLFFFNSLNKIKKTDVVFSSCAINYTKNPTETIKSIIELKTKYLYFTRMPLTENQSFEFKQISLLSDNGPCKINNEKEIIVEYKNKIIKKQKFEEIFKNKYIIIAKYIDEKKTFFHNKKFFDTYTYVLKKK